MRKLIVAGNWKMNTDSQGSVALAEGIASKSEGIAGEKVDVLLCPPFIYLSGVVKAVKGTKISVGAQDVYFEGNGAFTGEISVSMLKDVGCSFVLCGHSERRHIIGEGDELINKKLSASIIGGLLPILCIGETKEQRESGKTAEVVKSQLAGGFSGFSKKEAMAITIAYEPVWAIGTGLTATPGQAQEVHSMIREQIGQMYDEPLAEEMRILYGGSAKPDNAAELMSQDDIDGVLVGGASLKVDAFSAIIESAVS